ncbi:MAG TPA: dTDP-4-amino-4,6-dideoxygalactose transaminase [bacterium]|jgi:dTDP-4-amino-4,6-dideoxygalactose transaminase|nr:dTDP-4-amino-4,6-dideoxygalactose transaminase [bacterium]
MPSPDLSFHRSWVGRAEASALGGALAAGLLGGGGTIGRRVERDLARRLGTGRAFLMPSGSAALELSMMALGLKAGDEVILPSFNFVSGANAVLRQGCKAVFADVDPLTLCLDPSDAERRITRRTKAILLVHYAGVACAMDAFLKLKKKYGLALIEDAALAFGASYRGRPLGGIGDLGCFSFHATKHLTCGEGGALAGSRRDLIKRIEIIQEKGTDRSAFLRGERDRYTWRSLGSSYLLSDLLAAMLEAQLGRAAAIHLRLVSAWKAYQTGLAPLAEKGLISLPRPPAEAAVNGSIFWMLLEGPWKGRRPEILKRLKAAGVPATFHYVPLHRSPFGRALYGKQKAPLLAVTRHADRDLIRLPMHALLKKADCLAVCRAVSGILS